MTDTPETLQSALDDLTRRVAAFEKAQKEADVEPPMLQEGELDYLYKYGSSFATQKKASMRLRWCEAELARLREDYQALKDSYNRGSTVAHAYCHEFKVGRLGYSMVEEAILDARRLREGLKVRESDITSLELESWGDDNDFEYRPEEMRSYIRSQCRMMAREIQRHRALVTK